MSEELPEVILNTWSFMELFIMLWTINQPENRTKTNQSMNSPEKKSMNENDSINQSNSPSNQTTKQLTNQSINQQTHQSIKQMHQPITQPINAQKKKTHTFHTHTGDDMKLQPLGNPDSTAWRIVVYVVITHKPGVLSGGHFCLVV